MNLDREIGDIRDEQTQIVVREMWRRIREAVSEIDRNADSLRSQLADWERRIAFLESTRR